MIQILQGYTIISKIEKRASYFCMRRFLFLKVSFLFSFNWHIDQLLFKYDIIDKFLTTFSTFSAEFDRSCVCKYHATP